MGIKIQIEISSWENHIELPGRCSERRIFAQGRKQETWQNVGVTQILEK